MYTLLTGEFKIELNNSVDVDPRGLSQMMAPFLLGTKVQR